MEFMTNHKGCLLTTICKYSNGFNTTMLKNIFKNLLQFQWSSPFLALVTAAG